MRYIGLDLGTKTIGVALSDEQGIIASPLKTIARKGGKTDFLAVRDIIEANGVGVVVLGLPLELSGAEGESAKRVRTFGAQLADAVRVGAAIALG